MSARVLQIRDLNALAQQNFNDENCDLSNALSAKSGGGVQFESTDTSLKGDFSQLKTSCFPSDKGTQMWPMKIKEEKGKVVPFRPRPSALPAQEKPREKQGLILNKKITKKSGLASFYEFLEKTTNLPQQETPKRALKLKKTEKKFSEKTPPEPFPFHQNSRTPHRNFTITSIRPLPSLETPSSPHCFTFSNDTRLIFRSVQNLEAPGFSQKVLMI